MAISILSHPDDHTDFIRTVLLFHQNRYGILITELPQNSIIIPDIFEEPKDIAVNILLIIVFFIVAILGTILLIYSVRRLLILDSESHPKIQTTEITRNQNDSRLVVDDLLAQLSPRLCYFLYNRLLRRHLPSREASQPYQVKSHLSGNPNDSSLLRS